MSHSKMVIAAAISKGEMLQSTVHALGRTISILKQVCPLSSASWQQENNEHSLWIQGDHIDRQWFFGGRGNPWQRKARLGVFTHTTNLPDENKLICMQLWTHQCSGNLLTLHVWVWSHITKVGEYVLVIFELPSPLECGPLPNLLPLLLASTLRSSVVCFAIDT